MQNYYGIFLNLQDSTFIADVFDFRFYFSSASNMKKFMSRYIDYCECTKFKLQNYFGIEILETTNFALLSLYGKIEKRGFKVTQMKDGEVVKTFNEKPSFKMILKN